MCFDNTGQEMYLDVKKLIKAYILLNTFTYILLNTFTYDCLYEQPDVALRIGREVS